MQLPPSKHLAGIVKHYLILESEKEASYRLFSDGNPGIVFHFKNPLIHCSNEQSPEKVQPHNFIYGQITHYNDLKANGSLGMLVVVLQPYGLHSLLRIAASELNNCIIALSDLFGREVINLEDRLCYAQDTKSFIESVERFLASKLLCINKRDSVFEESLDFINRRRGTITVEEVLKYIPVTERQLERKFRTYIGTTPKNFVDIIRLQNFLKLLRSHPTGEKISNVIYDGGYYDQSHLNRYFKKITGITPWQYRIDHQRLAINFMLLSAKA